MINMTKMGMASELTYIFLGVVLGQAIRNKHPILTEKIRVVINNIIMATVMPQMSVMLTTMIRQIRIKALDLRKVVTQFLFSTMLTAFMLPKSWPPILREYLTMRLADMRCSLKSLLIAKILIQNNVHLLGKLIAYPQFRL